MILGFNKQFNSKIEDGTKIHTIRKGNRWRAGMKIHYYNSVRTKQMTKFRPDGVVVSVQDIIIKWVYGGFSIIVVGSKSVLLSADMEKLALNDGFDSLDEFKEWFKEDFEGQLIHWTTFKY